MILKIRPVAADDHDALVDLWHKGWHEAHAAHVPAELVRRRTRASFEKRLREFGDAARTAGPLGHPLGLCVVEGAEIDQLYVGSAARGTGLAELLLNDGLARIAATGCSEAFLYCEPKNDRAARFYGRMGWKNAGERVVPLFTDDGPIEHSVIVFRIST